MKELNKGYEYMNEGYNYVYYSIPLLTYSPMGCFLIDKHLELLYPRIWRMNINEILAYVCAVYPHRYELKNGEKFIKKCIDLFPNEKKWKELK